MINENNLVIKENLLIEAIYDLTTLELKLTMIGISMIYKENKKFMPTIISIEDFSKITYTNKNHLYSRIKKSCDNLGSRTLKILNKEKNEYDVYPWFSHIKYSINEGTVMLEFNEKIRPFLLLLKNNFTVYSLKYIVNMNSKYSIRIYELLKQYENIGTRKFRIEEFKMLLNINNKYKLYGHLKKIVLEPAKKEIEKCSDIKFTYKEIKEGRKIIGINFNIINIKKGEDYEKYDKFKLITKIQDIFFNKFGVNINNIDLTKKHRIIIITILTELKNKKVSKIVYPERWFIKYVREIEDRYDPVMIKEKKDF